MRLHYQINKRYLTTGTRQLCEPVSGDTHETLIPKRKKAATRRPDYLNPPQVSSAPARLA